MLAHRSGQKAEKRQPEANASTQKRSKTRTKHPEASTTTQKRSKINIYNKSKISNKNLTFKNPSKSTLPVSIFIVPMPIDHKEGSRNL